MVMAKPRQNPWPQDLRELGRGEINLHLSFPSWKRLPGSGAATLAPEATRPGSPQTGSWMQSRFPSESLNHAAFSDPSTQTLLTVFKPGKS